MTITSYSIRLLLGVFINDMFINDKHRTFSHYLPSSNRTRFLMMKHIVLESQINDLAIIKINRPEVLNALDKEVAAVS